MQPQDKGPQYNNCIDSLEKAVKGQFRWLSFKAAHALNQPSQAWLCRSKYTTEAALD